MQYSTQLAMYLTEQQHKTMLEINGINVTLSTGTSIANAVTDINNTSIF